MASAGGKQPIDTEPEQGVDTRANPGLSMRIALMLYEIAWLLLLPIAFFLLWRKGKREPLYRQYWGERLGGGFSSGFSGQFSGKFGGGINASQSGGTVNRLNTNASRPIWVHSASLGEMRGAAPLIQALLDQRFNLVITTLTPAGRSSAQALFATAIASGQAQVSFVPIEQTWAIRRFIRHFNPRSALMTEIDTWPLLVTTIRRAGIKLAIVNAQYPKQSLARDVRWGGFRANLFRCYQLVLCKSETHAQRFRQVGCQTVVVAGETRFDLPIPNEQLLAADSLLRHWGLSNLPNTLSLPSNFTSPSKHQRAIICIASSVAGEEAQFLQAYRLIQAAFKSLGRPKPLFIHVPRNAQLFDQIYQDMIGQGFAVVKRSTYLDKHLSPRPTVNVDIQATDIVLGDSLREMYFYLSLAMVVVVGASFVPLGSHNVIEPLGLKKPVMVGPSIWGIEYPGVDALAACVLTQYQSINELAGAIVELLTKPGAYAQSVQHADAFYAAHAGATQRHMAALLPWLPAA